MNYNKCEENISVHVFKKNCNSFIHIKSGSFKISWFQSLTKKNQWQDNRFSVKGSQYKGGKAIEEYSLFSLLHCQFAYQNKWERS